MQRYCQHLPFAFDRQLLLADLVGDLPWSYDLEVGILSFGERYAWRAEILGTESQESGTWLWAWANDVNNIPEQQQGASLKLRTLGEEDGIVELTEPMVRLDHADGGAFAGIAVGAGLGKACYRGTYDGGAAILLITDEGCQLHVEDPLHRILTVFPQAISAMEIADHREALRGYLEHYGFEPEGRGDTLLLREGRREVLHAEFDEHGRLRELTVTLGSETQGAKS